LTAARLSTERRLPLADSVNLATAQAHAAVLWTQDADFKGMPGVEYRKHRSDGAAGSRLHGTAGRQGKRQRWGRGDTLGMGPPASVQAAERLGPTGTRRVPN
jgi:hypothetical protein